MLRPAFASSAARATATSNWKAPTSLIDCASPIPEPGAAAILATLRASDSPLQTLRYWNTWLRVSTFVVDDAGKSARALDAELSNDGH